MAILREKKVWKRVKEPRARRWGFALTRQEREHVRRALALLCARHTVQGVAAAWDVSPRTVMRYCKRSPSPGLALVVAKLAEMSVEALLAGEMVPGPCPMCGRSVG